jgi:cytochrome P450
MGIIGILYSFHADARPTQCQLYFGRLQIYIHMNGLQGEFLNEIFNFVKTSYSSPVPTPADIDLNKIMSSPLLNSSLKETLRLHGHSLSPRDLAEDTVLRIEGKNYLLKKGSLSFAPSTILNRNPNIYPNPDTWIADRFIEKEGPEEYLGSEFGTKSETKKFKMPLLIWGGGPHMVDTFVIM